MARHPHAHASALMGVCVLRTSRRLHGRASQSVGTPRCAKAPAACSLEQLQSLLPHFPVQVITARLSSSSAAMNASWPQPMAAHSGGSGGLRASGGRAPMAASASAAGGYGALGGYTKAGPGSSSHEGHSTIEVWGPLECARQLACLPCDPRYRHQASGDLVRHLAWFQDGRGSRNQTAIRLHGSGPRGSICYRHSVSQPTRQCLKRLPCRLAKESVCVCS